MRVCMGAAALLVPSSAVSHQMFSQTNGGGGPAAQRLARWRTRRSREELPPSEATVLSMEHSPLVSYSVRANLPWTVRKHTFRWLRSTSRMRTARRASVKHTWLQVVRENKFTNILGFLAFSHDELHCFVSGRSNPPTRNILDELGTGSKFRTKRENGILHSSNFGGQRVQLESFLNRL